MPTLPPFHTLIEAAGTFYDQYGYLVVFLGTLFENTALLGLFLPGNSLALLGAFYAREGTLNLGWVIFFAWLGTVLGYNIDYLIGRFALSHVVAWLSKSALGRRLRLAGRVRLAHTLLTRHGGKAILISHMIGHIRSFVALSAGATRMNYPRFLLFEMMAALVWNTLFCLLGYALALEIDRLEMIIVRGGWIVVAILILLFLGWRLLRKKQQKQQSRKRLHHMQWHTRA
jgi:membrane protein DedA with SNARE-associated domain